MVFFDIGSTLIDGPTYGPAERLVQNLALPIEMQPEVERLLFQSPLEDADQLADILCTHFGVQQVQARQEATDLWFAQIREARAIPGAVEAIRRITGAGLRVAYLSNIWPPYYAGFSREFPDETLSYHQFLSFRMGISKPDESIYRLALETVEEVAGNTVMIGDTYQNDIAPAISLGM